MGGTDLAEGILSRLARDDAIMADRTAVIVAHPDDETLGLGAQLLRLPNIMIVHVTDGAPRDLDDARRLGFETAQAYAAARRRELEAAMALVGIGPDRLVECGVPDQEAAFHLVPVARRLASLFVEHRIELVFTHAYEGGHPDHDATVFAVHAAAALADRPPVIVEMPYYHAAPDGMALQRFLPADGPELAIWLSDEQRALKQRLFAAHASQRAVIDQFPIAVERFRVAPAYDFTELPPVDVFLYERQGWGLTAPQWVDLARRASAELAEAVR